ncbi:MAG TPA: quinohemoprotein amine dehydrogenase subunit alpha [Longimicrobiales bacterium]|nr:quinohemoprotein amine dehydrogenase subunit alpha [Longimicrobiales bacterium]
MNTTGRSARISWLALLCFAQPALAQVPRDTASGYPIDDAAVRASCAGCHAADSTGRMSRISWQRKTPEGWELTIRRMAALNGARFEPEAARAVLKYLSTQQGLAPEELRPGRFEVERRMIDYAYPGDRRTEDTCRACHSMGRVITQRRTREEWSLLVAMHRGFYPGVDAQGFRRGGPPPAGGDATHPMDAAIRHLATAFPLVTPEWTAWSATMRPPRIEGTWAMSGTEPGRGAFFGHMTIARSGLADDEFTTTARYTYVNGATTVTRDGRAVVYTGHQWRGRSSASGADEPWREVMMVEPGWASLSGRWYRGDYDEFGMDVALMRAGNDVVLAGMFPTALRQGASGQEVRIYGSNLQTAAVDAIDFGPGVHVERVVSASPEVLTLSLRTDASATIGRRDLFLAGAALRGAAVVYDTISRIRITPLAGMARVGGIVFPKQYQQFDVVAYHDGADRKPDTADDLELGPVAVSWSMEEYGVTYDDDDLQFVGQLDQRGLFTPAEDGPNPKRSGERNNIGDVWVVATHAPQRPGARPLRARAHLLVTVPLYMRWDPWRMN